MQSNNDVFYVSRDMGCNLRRCWDRCRVVRNSRTDQMVTGHLSARKAAEAARLLNLGVRVDLRGNLIVNEK